jgi:hypothetical protein
LSICGGTKAKKAEPVATANGPAGPWLISNVGQIMSKQTSLPAIAVAIIASLSYLSLSQHRKIVALESSLLSPEPNRPLASMTANKAHSKVSVISATNPGLNEAITASDSDSLRPDKLTQLDTQRHRLEQLGRFGEIFAALRLTPEQVLQFKDLLLEKGHSRQDMFETAPGVGVDTFSKEWMSTEKVIDSAIEDRIRTVLGDSSYGDYQAVEKKRALDASLRFLSDTGCVGFLIDAGAPLSADQLNALAAIYHRLQREGKMSSGDGVDSQTGLLPGHQEVLVSAATVLTPDQISALRQFYRSFFPLH